MPAAIALGLRLDRDGAEVGLEIVDFVLAHHPLRLALHPLARVVVADVDLRLPVDVAFLREHRRMGEPFRIPLVCERTRILRRAALRPRHPQPEPHSVLVQEIRDRLRTARKTFRVPAPVTGLRKPHGIGEIGLEPQLVREARAGQHVGLGLRAGFVAVEVIGVAQCGIRLVARAPREQRIQYVAVQRVRARGLLAAVRADERGRHEEFLAGQNVRAEIRHQPGGERDRVGFRIGGHGAVGGGDDFSDARELPADIEPMRTRDLQVEERDLGRDVLFEEIHLARIRRPARHPGVPDSAHGLRDRAAGDRSGAAPAQHLRRLHVLIQGHGERVELQARLRFERDPLGTRILQQLPVFDRAATARRLPDRLQLQFRRRVMEHQGEQSFCRVVLMAHIAPLQGVRLAGLRHRLRQRLPI